MDKEKEKKILEGLNKEQKAAVVKIKNPVRILAGAGSGKTKVLTHKIAYLIQVANISPKRIVALTFTNKAANEMKSRVEQLIGETTSDMIISTFHSFCYKFLRKEISSLSDYSNNFAILDAKDQENVLREIYRANDISKNTLTYAQAKDYISSLKNKDKEFEPKSKFDLNLMKDLKDFIFIKYQETLKISKSLDFDDLLILTKRILENNQKIREKWQNKFDYFLIDEFQDTSKIQFDIINLLLKKPNITIVGDPDQTIYSWRGADISFINNFDKMFKNVLTITLNQNYRSTKNILKVANNLIKHNSNRIPKDLVTENEEGNEIQVYDSSNQDNESLWVVYQINRLKKEKNQLRDIAILYRSNYYSRSIEDALIKESIPYKIINGQKFYERSEIKDVLAYLRCIYEPTNISLLRIINTPSRSLGRSTVEKLLNYANSKNMDLWESWIKHINNIEIVRDKKEKLFNFIEVLRKHNVLIERKEPVHLVLESLLKEINYFAMLEENEENGDNDRLENVKELIKSIKNWESNNPNKYVREYLDFVSLESLNIEDSTNIDYISLMTVHAAKGLEFKNIFVIGLNEGIFPSSKSILADEEDGEGELIEEERRLAYVAFTRAKENLFLSSVKDFVIGSNSKNIVKTSRFLIEANLKEVTKYSSAKQIIEMNSKINKDFSPGDKVKHINFGEGIVLDVNGDSIIIEFKNKEVGIKQLLKNHKSLEKVE